MDMRYWLIGTTLACLAVLGCDGDGRINQTSTNADTGGTDVSTGEADTDLRDATINDATINLSLIHI